MAGLPHPDGGEIGGLRRPGAGAPITAVEGAGGGGLSDRDCGPVRHGVRERLAVAGPAGLSAGELVALVWGSGSSAGFALDLAHGVLARHGSLADLARADVLELTHQSGIGPARAAQLVAAFELGRRSLSTVAIGRWTVRSPRDVADRLSAELSPLEREELYVLSLNAKNVVLRQSLVYRGNVSSAVVRIGELFRDPVRIHAAGLIVVHNHPSGDAEPSPDDLHLTAEAVAAGRLLDVPVLDHVVIASAGWVSLRDRGVAFDRTAR